MSNIFIDTLDGAAREAYKNRLPPEAQCGFHVMTEMKRVVVIDRWSHAARMVCQVREMCFRRLRAERNVYARVFDHISVDVGYLFFRATSTAQIIHVRGFTVFLLRSPASTA